MGREQLHLHFEIADEALKLSYEKTVNGSVVLHKMVYLKKNSLYAVEHDKICKCISSCYVCFVQHKPYIFF
jgi:hypothetical protein